MEERTSQRDDRQDQMQSSSYIVEKQVEKYSYLHHASKRTSYQKSNTDLTKKITKI